MISVKKVVYYEGKIDMNALTESFEVPILN